MASSQWVKEEKVNAEKNKETKTKQMEMEKMDKMNDTKKGSI